MLVNRIGFVLLRGLALELFLSGIAGTPLWAIKPANQIQTMLATGFVQVTVDELCLHRFIQLIVPTTFYFDNDRNTIVFFSSLFLTNRINLNINPFPWCSSCLPSNFDLSINNHPCVGIPPRNDVCVHRREACRLFFIPSVLGLGPPAGRAQVLHPTPLAGPLDILPLHGRQPSRIRIGLPERSPASVPWLTAQPFLALTGFAVLYHSFTLTVRTPPGFHGQRYSSLRAGPALSPTLPSAP